MAIDNANPTIHLVNDGQSNATGKRWKTLFDDDDEDWLHPDDSMIISEKDIEEPLDADEIFGTARLHHSRGFTQIGKHRSDSVHQRSRTSSDA